MNLVNLVVYLKFVKYKGQAQVFYLAAVFVMSVLYLFTKLKRDITKALVRLKNVAVWHVNN